ncbi:hypothetical protein EW146_g1486 [Bondarzewia mesenterica]|uniref:Peptidase S8/S53 domain-containing protein n=1 Tax=Bondarzewia mesenterica TaxID=1095465 RepID=A0A4S4M538_9AGAM|nr:hypothetical protein EW146_g1486 [Bondarzewia mesenterica]
MRFSTLFFSLALLAAPVFGASTNLLKIEKFGGAETTGRYIVKLKDTASKTTHLDWFRQLAGSNATVTHDWNADFLNGYAGNFDDASLTALRASPDVEYIAEDGIMHITATVTQTNAPWGLSRLSQNGPISDTGIFTSHSDFGGRARWGATFGGYANADGNGHGTHVAGTAAGTRWGVAKSASLIAIKVLSDQGSGSVSDIVSGLNFVASSVASSGRPSIATMSLGGSASTTLDNAVTSLVSKGIHVTVAAGNYGIDAGETSPARVAVANTVGASTVDDDRALFSNFGSVVDIFAPGQDVTSAWIGSTTATNTISGTSMASTSRVLFQDGYDTQRREHFARDNVVGIDEPGHQRCPVWHPPRYAKPPRS